MAGGNANIVGAFFGALIVGIVNNGLNLLGVDSSWQVVAKGALILIAVVLDSISTMILRKVNTNA
jgi:ribose/xylose/arabinose/galactoside ABC-type transport system permease subunit